MLLIKQPKGFKKTMSKVTRVHLLLIDPQNDFCDPKGSLYVTGADKDMDRVAAMIDRLGSRLDDLHITLDSHRNFDVAHPMYWKDSKGNHPNPFTLISVKDVENGVWVPSVPSLFKRTIEYVKELERKGKYVLCIWNPHCLIGSWGHNVYPSVLNAASSWEKKNIGMINFVTKGSNPYTEHFSAISSEVIDPSDASTQINSALISTLENDCDLLLIAGEAQSHCVRSTVNDIVKNFSDPKVAQKMVLLTDGMSSVQGFEKFGTDFMDEAKAAGVQFSTTTDILK
jgi:nicotinamidase/pyrazinamidase